MKILVVGANGFLGSNIVLQGINKKWEVWGTTYHKKHSNIPSGCKVVGISNVEKVKELFDVVFLAVGNFSLSHKELINANVRVTNTICNKYKEAKIVFVSSISVNGLQNNIITEQTSFNNPSIYGLSKIAGEFIILNHPKYSIVRLTYLYGAGMKTNSFLPIIIKDAVQKKMITLYGDGTRKQDYLHVKDAADLCIRAGLNKKNDIYLGASRRSLSNLQVARNIQEFIPDCKIKFSGIDKAQSFVFDSSKTEAKLNWKPKYSFKKGLKEIINDLQ